MGETHVCEVDGMSRYQTPYPKGKGRGRVLREAIIGNCLREGP